MVGLAGEEVAAARAAVREQPDPVEWRRSISAQSGGAEHVVSVPVSFSTHRKAGCPRWNRAECRPGWRRSGTRGQAPTRRGRVPSATQRAMWGALPSRIAGGGRGGARPSISRKTIPGRSVSTRSPERFARRMDHAQRVRVVVGRADHHLQDDAHGGRDERHEESAEPVDPDRPVGDRVRGQQDRRVGDEHQQEAGDQRERKPQAAISGGRSVEDADDHGDQEGAPRSPRSTRRG